MMLKFLQKTLIFFIAFSCFSQKNLSTKLGNITIDELKMSAYSKDTLAEAVVLFEHANVYLDEKNDYKFRTDYYFRIKLFNKEAFSKATIQILLNKNEYTEDIKAVTYNLKNGTISKTYLDQNQKYKSKLDSYWSDVRFTLPNLKEGSIIEYKYSVISPYSTIDDWYFQSDIPKIKSVFNSSIVLNYKYKVRLIGSEELDYKDISIKKDCLHIDHLGSGGCLNYEFKMYDIPAFKEEAYMLSKKNYISRLVFDRLSFTDTRGVTTKYTKTWEDADLTFKKYFLDNQNTKANYFKKHLPNSILTITNNLEKAKKIYKHLQTKLFWNNKNWTRKKLNIKNTFEQGSGSVDAINLILYNSLKAAGIESYIVASSTRDNGLPTKVYPIIKDFNYVLVKVNIDNTTYFLDATDKLLAFGQLPLKCLNGDARVLDFKNGSNWERIKTSLNTRENIQTTLTLTKNDELKGKLLIKSYGYDALSSRKSLQNKTTEEFLDTFESVYPNILVDHYKDENKHNFEKPLIQHLDISIDIDDKTDILHLKPFIYKQNLQNPFKLENRKYAVDYGYPRSLNYALQINIPDTYEIVSLPEKKMFALPNNGGNFSINVTNTDHQILLYTRMNILKQVYSYQEYAYLKEFYNQIIKVQQSTIQLKKKI